MARGRAVAHGGGVPDAGSSGTNGTTLTTTGLTPCTVRGLPSGRNAMSAAANPDPPPQSRAAPAGFM